MSNADKNKDFYLSTTDRDTYKGIQMFAVDGLHEHLGSTLKTSIKPGGKILDVGCGRGAFSLRLFDLGFKVDACDMIDQCECKDEVNFIHMKAEDVELPKKHYDAICMVEVLEHVESPFALLRKYSESLKDDGVLYVTSPAIDSKFSRAWFYLTGRHWYFEDENITNDGHIMPIHEFQMKYIADELGFKMMKEDCHESRHAKLGFFYFAILLLKLYQTFKGKKKLDGPVTIYRFSKA